MIQLDLFGVEPLDATYPSDRPLRSTDAIRREQENCRRLQRHHQRQELVPLNLRRDQWTLYKDPEGYRLFHTYTALETDATPHQVRPSAKRSTWQPSLVSCRPRIWRR